MSVDSHATELRTAHAAWLRDKAGHFRRLASGAVPFAVARDLETIAIKYERLAAALENDSPVPVMAAN